MQEDGGIMAKRRTKGEGCYDTKVIKGIEYKRYRKEYEGYGLVTKYGRTMKELKQKIKDFEASMSLLPKEEIMKQTLDEYATNWFKNIYSKKNIERSTYDRKEAVINLIRNYDIAKTQFANIGKKEIENFLSELSTKYSKSSIDKVYFTLNQIYRYAVQNEDIKKNPMNQVSMVPEKEVAVKKKEARYLEMDDVELLTDEAMRLNTIENSVNGPVGSRVYGINAVAVALIPYTGLRIGELFGLRWKNIDFKEGLLYVAESRATVKNRDEDADKKTVYEFKDPKTPESIRYIPLADKAIELLHEMEKFHPEHKHDDLIFRSRTGNTPSHSTVQRTFNAMMKRAGTKVQSCNLHGLRHSFATNLLNYDDKQLPVISSLIGHKSIDTTSQVYAHVLKKKKAEAIDLFNNR